MKVSRGEDAGEYRITFTFTVDELMEAGMEKPFAKMWTSTRKPSAYLEFINEFARGPRKRPADPYGFDPLRDAFRRRGWDPEDIFGNTRTGAEQFQRQYMGGFDPAAPGGDRTYYTNGQDPPKRHDFTTPTWTKVLGLPKTASKEDIKAKYRQLVKVHHPDAGGDARKFKEITEAYNEAMK